MQVHINGIRDHKAEGQCYMVERFVNQMYVDDDYGPQYFRGWFRAMSALTRNEAVAYAREVAMTSGDSTRIVACDKCEDHKWLAEFATNMA
jgi:hypothetical protein